MPDEPKGPLGDGDLRPGKYNMALVRRAIKNGWNVPEKYKEGVVTQMAKVAFSSPDERNKIAASRVLLEADKADQAFQMGEERGEGDTFNTQVNVTQIAAASAVVQEAANDPAYVEWLESQRLARDSDASSVRWVRGARVADGPTPGDSEPAIDAGLS